MSRYKKSIESRHVNRRQFLMGTGSAFLALPPLLSLMSEQAIAQLAATPIRRSVLWYGMNGVDGHHLFPSTQADLTKQTGTNVYTKPLANFSGQISRLIDSDFISMYPHMNLIQGLSLTGGNYQGHNVGILAGVHDAEGDRDPKYGQSADVIMERSLGVYKAGDNVPRKAIRLITGDHDIGFSYFFEAGSRKVSEGIQGDKNLFNALFASFTPPGGTATPSDDKLIVDKVYADLKKLESNPRISRADKIVLERYISSIYDLQLKVGGATSGPACTKPSTSFQAISAGNYYQLPEGGWGITNVGAMYDNYIELIKLAFACDLTRVVNVGCTLWTDLPVGKQSDGGLHHEVPNRIDPVTGQEVATSSQNQADRQKWHLKKFLKLAKSLQATQDPLGGGTLLDNSALLWTNEMGDWTTGHSTLNIPAVLLGSCGGYFKTGNFIDYRQRPMVTVDGSYFLGRPYKQLLQSIMTGMGVTKAEYIKYGDGNGFGEFKVGINQFGHVLSNAFAPYATEHNDPLAWIVK